MSEDIERVSARTRRGRRIRAEAAEAAEEERLARERERSASAIINLPSSSRTRTRAQQEAETQRLRRRREKLLRMLNGEEPGDVEAPIVEVQAMIIAGDDEAVEAEDDDFVPLESQDTQMTFESEETQSLGDSQETLLIGDSQGTQSTDPGTQSQQSFPILDVGIPFAGYKLEDDKDFDALDLTEDYAASPVSDVSYTFPTEEEEEGSIKDVELCPPGWDRDEANEERARAQRTKEICKDCAKEGHPSKRSPKCAQHFHPEGAPPFLTEEESKDYYFGKQYASLKTNFSTLIQGQFVVGTASFSGTEVIDRFNEYVKIVSITVHEFSLIFLAFVEQADDVQDIDFDLLRACYNAFMGRKQNASHLKQDDNPTDKQRAAYERREIRLAERAKFSNFIESINGQRRQYYNGQLPGAKTSYLAAFEDSLLKTLLTNIKTHLSERLKIALGKLLYTRLRRDKDDPISKKSSGIARRFFYKLYEAEYKEAKEEIEYETLPLGLDLQVASEVPADGGEGEDEEGEGAEAVVEEDDKNVVIPEHAVTPVTTEAIATDGQLRHIQGTLPPVRLFAKNETRYSEGKEGNVRLPGREKRRDKRREKQLEGDPQLPGRETQRKKRPGLPRRSRRSTGGEGGQHTESVVTSFNRTRTLNYTTKRARKAEWLKKNKPEVKISYPPGKTIAESEAEQKADDFHRDECRGFNTVKKRVTAFKNINVFMQEQNIKTFNLLPIFTAKAKHLSLNMTTLYDLLASFRKQGFPNRGDFNANISEHFFNIFKLSEKLKPQTGATMSEAFTATEYVERFTFQSASSDGKDASVRVFKWVRRKKPPEKAKDRELAREKYKKEQKEKAEAKRKSDMERLRQIQRNNSVKMVGIDPGRKDIMSGILGKNLGNRDKTTYALSNSNWVVISKRNRIIAKEMSYAIHAKVYEWRKNLPSARTNPMERIHYLFAPDSKLKDLYELYHSLKYKQLRRQSFIRRRKAVKRAIDEMLRKFQPNKGDHIFIAFGSAKFSQVSRGYAPGGNVAAFFKELKRRPNVHPVYVDEYHTSQVSVLIHILCFF